MPTKPQAVVLDELPSTLSTEKAPLTVYNEISAAKFHADVVAAALAPSHKSAAFDKKTHWTATRSSESVAPSIGSRGLRFYIPERKKAPPFLTRAANRELQIR